MSKKWVSTRFASPTQDFDLDVLVRRLRKGFVLSVALAAAVHLVVAGVNPFEEAKKTPRPLAIKFIKRHPRLTKPLELRKVPKRQRQLLRREVHMATARMSQVQATAAFSTRNLIAGLAGASKMPYGLPLTSLASDAETGMRLDVDLGISRTAENRIDMALEMLDVNALDTGRYRAMVIQDPNDKQALKGFIKFARVHSMGFVIDGSAEAATTGGLNTQEIDILCDMINEWTGLRADFVGSFTFADERLLDIPIIMPQGTPTEGELQNIARYLLGGGFVLLEGLDREKVRRGHRDIYGFWRKALEKYGGLVEGRDFYIARLPDEHPLFSAYFDLDAGAPLGASGFGMFTSLADFNVVPGLFVKGRLAAVPRPWGYGGILGHSNGVETTRILQFAVNTIVYALTQEGSVTQRLMQMVH